MSCFAGLFNTGARAQRKEATQLSADLLLIFQAAAALTLPPASAQIFAQLRHSIAEVEEVLREAKYQPRPWLLPQSAKVSPERSWELTYPLGGKLLRRQMCMASTGDGIWHVGGLCISDVGLVFDSPSADAGFCTGLLLWQDIVSFDRSTLELKKNGHACLFWRIGRHSKESSHHCTSSEECGCAPGTPSTQLEEEIDPSPNLAGEADPLHVTEEEVATSEEAVDVSQPRLASAPVVLSIVAVDPNPPVVLTDALVSGVPLRVMESLGRGGGAWPLIMAPEQIPTLEMLFRASSRWNYFGDERPITLGLSGSTGRWESEADRSLPEAPADVGNSLESDDALHVLDYANLSLFLPERVNRGFEAAGSSPWNHSWETPPPSSYMPQAPEAVFEPITVMLYVPEGAVPGTKLMYTAPDGQALRLTIPEGVAAGCVMTLTQDPRTKAWKCMAEPAEPEPAFF